LKNNVVYINGITPRERHKKGKAYTDYNHPSQGNFIIPETFEKNRRDLSKYYHIMVSFSSTGWEIAGPPGLPYQLSTIQTLLNCCLTTFMAGASMSQEKPHFKELVKF